MNINNYDSKQLIDGIGQHLVESEGLQKGEEHLRGTTAYWLLGIDRDVCVRLSIANAKEARVQAYEYKKAYNVNNGVGKVIEGTVRLDMFLSDWDEAPAVHTVLHAILKK